MHNDDYDILEDRNHSGIVEFSLAVVLLIFNAWDVLEQFELFLW